MKKLNALTIRENYDYNGASVLDHAFEEYADRVRIGQWKVTTECKYNHYDQCIYTIVATCEADIPMDDAPGINVKFKRNLDMYGRSIQTEDVYDCQSFDIISNKYYVIRDFQLNKMPFINKKTQSIELQGTTTFSNGEALTSSLLICPERCKVIRIEPSSACDKVSKCLLYFEDEKKYRFGAFKIELRNPNEIKDEDGNCLGLQEFLNPFHVKKIDFAYDNNASFDRYQELEKGKFSLGKENKIYTFDENFSVVSHCKVDKNLGK